MYFTIKVLHIQRRVYTTLFFLCCEINFILCFAYFDFVLVDGLFGIFHVFSVLRICMTSVNFILDITSLKLGFKKCFHDS